VAMFGLVSSVPGSGRTGFLVAEILDLGILGGIGYLTYQEIHHSALARGFMVGVSLAFLLNAICGVVMLSLR
ncbi:MAG: hypothetical protein WB817_15555, partial [Terriglobales bacterium]